MTPKNYFSRLVQLGSGLVCACFILAHEASAATVYNCSTDGTRCVAKLELGSVGDTVKVLDEKARQVARGRIVRRKGPFAVISLTEVTQTVRRGYPVIVNIDSKHSETEWAANFSNKD